MLKVQPLGGVRAALAIAEAAGVPAIPTSMMETSVGLAAGLALAAALPDLPVRLRPRDRVDAPGRRDARAARPVDGRLRVRRVVPDADLLARYADSEAIR